MFRRARFVLAVTTLAVALAGCDWLSYLGGPRHGSYADDAGIYVTDVPALTSQWRWHPEVFANRPDSLFGTPATWKGRVFLGGNNGIFVALDAATGNKLWERDFGFQPAIKCNAAGISSSAAVRDDGNGNPLVYLNAPDGYLYELNGLTGATVWRSIVKIPSTTKNDAMAWSSPTFANGRVYIGVASNCDLPLVRGAVKSYDQTTGALLATFYTMPAGYVGAGVWTSVAVDENAVYVTTGNASEATDAAHPPTTTNSFDQYSILKLDPTTLAITGKWPAPVTPGIDLDWGASPVLFTATLGGTSVQMVGTCNKDGNFYALRTDTMTPVWQRTIGQSQAEGEVACLSGGVWDGTRLFVAGNTTTIASQSVPGSVRRLDPATGDVLWETALGANPLGSGTINANGILAYAGTDWAMGPGNGVYLIDASNGDILRVLHDVGDFPEFAQPIWSDGRLLAANTDALVDWSR